MKQSNLRCLALGAVLFLAAVPVRADEPSGTSGSVTVSAQGGSGVDDSSKLQQFETVPQGVFLSKATLSWKGGSDYFLDMKGSKLGLDDQFASLVWGKKSKFDLSLSWDQNPNWMSNTSRTPYTETSPGVFRLPDGMRQALQAVYAPWGAPTTTNPVGQGSAPADPTKTGYFATEPWVADSSPIDLRYLRKTGTAGLTFKAGENLSFNIAYSRESRKGNKNTTFYGGANYEVATPIDYLTHDLRAEAEFAKGRFFANASMNFSKFQNDVPYAEIDNPQRYDLVNPATGRAAINDATTFRLWLPPDNQAYTVDFTGGVSLPQRHKLTASLSTGSMSMDTDLLAISTNPGLATSATAPTAAFTVTPPYSSVSAKFNTFMGAFKFTGDPVSKFGYILSYRTYKLTDKTEEYTFQSAVRGDVGASYSAAGYSREPEGWETQSMRGEVHALPASGLRLGLSYGQDKRTYDAREYADVKDNVLTATADYSYKWLSLHAGFTNLKRKPGGENAEAIQPAWQGATQQDIVERDRSSFSGLLTLTPNEKFAVALSAQKQTNDFPESVTGLLDQSFEAYGVDFTFTPNSKVNLSAGYVNEKYDFLMAAAYFPRGQTIPADFNPAVDPNYWENTTADKINTFRLGLDLVLKPEKLDIMASIDYSKPESDSQYTKFAAGGANDANGVWPANSPALPGFRVTSFTGFPLVSKEFIIAKVRLNYQIAKNVSACALWWWQKYDNVDWQTATTPYMGYVDPGSNRWFFLGAQVPSYDANIFRASLTYKF